MCYLWDEVQDGIAEERRRSQCHEGQLHVLVEEATPVVVPHQRHDDETNEREKTQKNHHQSTVAVS